MSVFDRDRCYGMFGHGDLMPPPVMGMLGYQKLFGHYGNMSNGMGAGKRSRG